MTIVRDGASVAAAIIRPPLRRRTSRDPGRDRARPLQNLRTWLQPDATTRSRRESVEPDQRDQRECEDKRQNAKPTSMFSDIVGRRAKATTLGIQRRGFPDAPRRGRKVQHLRIRLEHNAPSRRTNSRREIGFLKLLREAVEFLPTARTALIRKLIFEPLQERTSARSFPNRLKIVRPPHEICRRWGRAPACARYQPGPPRGSAMAASTACC